MAGVGRDVFTFEQAAGFWGGGQYARNSLARLESKGWLERLERGRYLLVPLEAGTDRDWSEDPLVIGSLLVPQGAAAYWTAARHWGWTTQLPRTQFFLTPARRFKALVTILGVPYRFVTLKPEKVFGISEEWRRSLRIRVTDSERTIVDVMDRPDLAGGMGEVVSTLALAWPQLDLAKLSEYVERFGSGTVPKRLGFLAEAAALPGADEWFDSWRSRMGAGVTLLERGGPHTGRILRRWNLQVNAGGISGDDRG